MKINKQYEYLFKKSKNGYLYPITKGIYLYFNNDYTYNGVVMFYSNTYFTSISKQEDYMLNLLLTKNILMLEGE